LLVERIEPRQLLRVFDSLAVSALFLEHTNETR